MAGLGVSMKNDGESKALLNTYIHNYFLQEGCPELAKALRNSTLQTKQDKLKKEGPVSQSNGADDDGDSKEDSKSRVSADLPGETFLLDYWFIFWDLWGASTKKEPSNGVPAQYLMHNQMRQQPMFPQQVVGVGLNGYNNPRMMQGVGPQQLTLQKNAMNNNAAQRNMGPQQFARMQGMPPQQQQQMQRDGSDMDVNQRPQSPISGGDSPPSSKRLRVEGPGFQNHIAAQRVPMGGQVPNGVVGNQEAMMMQNGMNGRGMQPGDMEKMMGGNKLMYAQTLANQQRSAMSGFQLPNGFTNAGGPGMSPTMMNDGQFDVNMMNGQMRGVAGTNGGALADYQMQLMLLEQQNKKRLIMARQEQEVAHTSSMMAGAASYTPITTSPHGRNGQSPNTDTKRNTPKMSHGSPLPDGTMPPNRSSPAPSNFDQQMGASQFMPGMMRPPGPQSMQQSDMMRNGARLSNGSWQGGPVQGGAMPQGPPVQQNQPDSAALQTQQRGNMPPPQIPAAGVGKTQPSPTQQNAPTPTAAQGSKSNTKAKKDAKETKKKAPKKSQPATNATPNPENDRPPTPTPQTPATPVAHEAHIIKGSQAQQQPTSNGQMQQQAQGNMQINQGMPSVNNEGPFGNIADHNEFPSFDFMNDHGPMPGDDTNDILGGFDFDTFMGDPTGMNWDADFSIPGDGLETGAGQ